MQRDAVDKLEAALLKRPDDPDLLYYLEPGARASVEAGVRPAARRRSPDSAREQTAGGGSGPRREIAAGGGEATSARRWPCGPICADVAFRARRDVLRNAGDYEHAEAEFRAEARLAPGSAAAAYKLGVVLLNRGQVRDAISELKRANSLQPDMPETLLELGKALRFRRSGKAEKYLQQVLKLEPSGNWPSRRIFNLRRSTASWAAPPTPIVK